MEPDRGLRCRRRPGRSPKRWKPPPPWRSTATSLAHSLSRSRDRRHLQSAPGAQVQAGGGLPQWNALNTSGRAASGLARSFHFDPVFDRRHGGSHFLGCPQRRSRPPPPISPTPSSTRAQGRGQDPNPGGAPHRRRDRSVALSACANATTSTLRVGRDAGSAGDEPGIRKHGAGRRDPGAAGPAKPLARPGHPRDRARYSGQAPALPRTDATRSARRRAGGLLRLRAESRARAPLSPGVARSPRRSPPHATPPISFCSTEPSSMMTR